MNSKYEAVEFLSFLQGHGSTCVAFLNEYAYTMGVGVMARVTVKDKVLVKDPTYWFYNREDKVETFSRDKFMLNVKGFSEDMGYLDMDRLSLMDTLASNYVETSFRIKHEELVRFAKTSRLTPAKAKKKIISLSPRSSGFYVEDTQLEYFRHPGQRNNIRVSPNDITKTNLKIFSDIIIKGLSGDLIKVRATSEGMIFIAHDRIFYIQNLAMV